MAMAQFWNPTYSCFAFRKVDLVPIVEEYTTLHSCPNIQVCKAYYRVANVPTFVKKLINITGMSEQWVTARIQQKEDNKCIPWISLRDLILAHPDVKKKVDTHWMKRLAIGLRTTPEYNGWFNKRINDNIPGSSLEGARSMEEYLQVVPSELEIIRNWRLRNYKKGKNKAEEDLDSLKTDYKKLCLSMRTTELGKTSEQWRQEIQEEKIKADRWERRCQEAQTRNEALEKRLSKAQDEKIRLKARIAELEKSLHQHRSHNSVMKLKASLDKTEELKRKVQELEIALQNSELRIEFLEASNKRCNE
ncbi:hypothetical protein PVK06_028123 [Gossypium arboreum]|uniref:DUF7745 domain-containing protein n=1 Tax=Gossypium arboreum TaxID=29729 RepID=A0ABR0P264_GOSAR|nr:hypothetical protein PVK06_028123 [Gossypium arboreum]